MKSRRLSEEELAKISYADKQLPIRWRTQLLNELSLLNIRIDELEKAGLAYLEKVGGQSAPYCNHSQDDDDEFEEVLKKKWEGEEE